MVRQDTILPHPSSLQLGKAAHLTVLGDVAHHLAEAGFKALHGVTSVLSGKDEDTLFSVSAWPFQEAAGRGQGHSNWSRRKLQGDTGGSTPTAAILAERVMWNWEGQ